jgi:prevent-host-death family protein
MKTISISEAKATLSAQIQHVRNGEEVVIVDRGRPVARLVPVQPSQDAPDLDELVRAGLVRRGRTSLPARFWQLPRPRDAQGAVRAAATEEREDSW